MPTVEWKDLTPAERHLIECAAKGELADLIAKFPSVRERVIRPTVYRDLCLGRYEDYGVDPEGMTLRGAIFQEELGLKRLDLHVPLFFISCRFRKGLDVSNATMQDMGLLGCTVHGSLQAWGLTTTGSVAFTTDTVRPKKRFLAVGTVNLNGAHVGGTLNCRGAKFTHADGICFDAQEIRVADSVFLDEGFCAQGSVNFGGARIGGLLQCTGGTFLSTHKMCLLAQAVEVGHSVFLNDGFVAEGPVDFSGAKVGGQFTCEGGQFKSTGAKCLCAQSVGVGQHVFLSGAFHALGPVDFRGARVSGNFTCDHGKFDDQSMTCLFAQDIIITGSVSLCGSFEALGSVDFSGAQIGGQLASAGGKFRDPGERCLFLERIVVERDVFLRDVFLRGGEGSRLEVSGTVHLLGARVHGALQCIGGVYGVEGQAHGRVLNLNNATVDGVFQWSPWQVIGREIDAIGLRNAHVGTLDVAEKAVATDEQKRQFTLSGLTYDALDGGLAKDVKSLARWVDLADGGECLPQPYEQMVKVLRFQGHLDAARDIDIAKMRHRCREREGVHPIWKSLEIVFIDWLLGYGYQTRRAFVIAALLVLGAWVLFLLPDGGAFQPVAGNVQVFQAASRRSSVQVSPRYTFQPFVYALDVFLPVIDLQQENQWAPDSTRAQGDSRWIVVRLLTICGWLLTTLLIAAFTGIIKKG